MRDVMFGYSNLVMSYLFNATDSDDECNEFGESAFTHAGYSVSNSNCIRTSALDLAIDLRKLI